MLRINGRTFTSEWHAYNEHVGYDLYNAMMAAQKECDEFSVYFEDHDTRENYKKSMELDKAHRRAIAEYEKAVEKWVSENVDIIEIPYID